MAKIAVKPFVLKDCTVTIKDGSTAVGDYEAHVSKVSIDPNTPTQTWTGMTPSAVFVDAATTQWLCNVDYAQDYETANSFAQFLLANPGKQVTMEFTPKNGGTAKKATVTVICVPGSIGGTVGAFATASVALPVIGQPAIA
ncbi:MAG: hypothetical protein J0H64_03735 [Actinobacteria bacterium]|nr:hypothetical protein [Actinomycetota bacterium]